MDAIDSILMDKNIKLIAYFIEDMPPPVDSFYLELRPRPNAGGSADTSGKYPDNSIIQITAAASLDYKFINWTDENDVVIS